MDDLRLLMQFILLFVILFSSCTNSGDWTGIREVRNGIEFIQNTNQGVWHDSHQLVLNSEIRIGAEKSEENGFLQSVADIDVDSEGRIFVCDCAGEKVDIFDKTGKWLKTITQKQANDSKLRQPQQIELADDGKFWVLENRGQTICLFDKNGNFRHCFDPNMGRIYSIEASGKADLLFSRIPLNLGKSDTAKENLNATIFQVNQQGKSFKNFGELFVVTEMKRVVNPYANGWLTLAKNGELYETFHSPYLIRIYNKAGNLKKVIIKQGLQEPEQRLAPVPGLPLRIYMLMSKQVQPQCFQLPENRILVHVIDRGETYTKDISKSFFLQVLEKDSIPDFSRNYQHTYDLFDKKGRFMQSFTIEQFPQAVLKFVDKNHKMYIRSFDAKTGAYFVHRCRFEFRECGVEE
jgi:hypothetical protein